MSNLLSADKLQNIRRNNFRKLIVAHININSIRNIFDALESIVKGNVDILMVSETKLDDFFPQGQFIINGFKSPFQLDCNKNGGGIMLYIREDIENLPIEAFYVELTLNKKKLLLCCSYNPHYRNIEKHFTALTKSLDLYIPNYDHFLIMGDFNAEVSDKYLKNFCENYNLKSLISTSTCYKNPERPTCIDLCESNVVEECHEPLSQNIDVEQNIPEIVHINNGNRGKDGNKNQNTTENTFSSVLKEIRLKNVDRLILAHLNINSIRNKFEALSSFVTDNIDILLISETKIDSSFPDGQFLIKGFSTPFRKDRNANGGGLLLYVRDDIPTKLLKTFDAPGNFERFFL